jgi:RNA-directed DNA polymerase
MVVARVYIQGSTRLAWHKTRPARRVDTIEQWRALDSVIPPLVSFPSFEAFEVALREQMLGAGKSQRASNIKKCDDAIIECRRLRGLGLPPIASGATFGLLLGVSPRLITSMSTMPIGYWREFRLPKKSGGSRVIRAPRVFLKTVQTYILQNILQLPEEHPCAYGFTKGKGAYRNATQHLAMPHVWNTDIVQFFPSISATKVQELFVRIGFRKNVSWMLASLCTYQRKLPQGAPTSPRLSNLIFLPVDLQLQEIASQYNCIYTRYADDLTYSSISPIPRALFEAVGEILLSAGFLLNISKTRLRGPNSPRYVTGYVVNEKIQPDRTARRILRAKFHRLSTTAVLTDNDTASAQGWASYVFAYDPLIGSKYLAIVAQARKRAISDGGTTRSP